jgi:hypothetical protein
MPKPQYGHGTFYHAHPFKHHANKDPEKAFGDVVLSAWNPGMKRVELVLALDKDQALRLNAIDVIEKIEAGEFPDVSMGCKVPFDQCTICGHKSRTRADYCEHARTMMNKIMPDGTKVGVINWFPRFFDLSFVIIGADRTAKVMARLSGKGKRAFVFTGMGLPKTAGMEKAAAALLPGSDARHISQKDRHQLQEVAVPSEEALTAGKMVGRVASKAVHFPGKLGGKLSEEAIRAAARMTKEKVAATKISEIEKLIPPDETTGKLLARLEQSDKDLPDDVLGHLCSHGRGSRGMGEVLSSLGSMGMVLKPREFQRIILTRSGRPGAADALDRAGDVFRPVDDVDSSIPMGADLISRAIQRLLIPLLGQRSCLGPVFRKRIVIVVRPGSSGLGSPLRPRKEDLLDKLSSAYNGYRLGLINMVEDIPRSVESNPDVMKELIHDDFVGMMAGEKTAGWGPLAKTVVPLLLALAPLIYLSASHWDAQRNIHGVQLPLTKRLIADHPAAVSALTVGGGSHAAVGLDKVLARHLVRALA